MLDFFFRVFKTPTKITSVETVTLEARYEVFHSVLRRIEHIKTFGQEPQTIETLRVPKCLLENDNASIFTVLNSLRSNPYSIFPKKVDHWTSIENLKNILTMQSFLANKLLTRYNIPFEKNVLDFEDLKNLDGNVICFSPGRFLDTNAVFSFGTNNLRHDRILIRLNSNSFQKVGKYNVFFKIVDLCGPGFFKNIHISSDFTIELFRRSTGCQFAVGVKFHFNHFCEEVYFDKKECIFYGEIEDINSFCLLLLFNSLEKCKNKTLVDAIYNYFQKLTYEEMASIIIGFSKGITKVSEFNVRGFLKIQPNMIHSIHFANKGYTYHFPENGDTSEIDNFLFREYSLPIRICNYLTYNLLRNILWSNSYTDEKVTSDESAISNHENVSVLHGEKFWQSDTSGDMCYRFNPTYLCIQTSLELSPASTQPLPPSEKSTTQLDLLEQNRNARIVITSRPA